MGRRIFDRRSEAGRPGCRSGDPAVLRCTPKPDAAGFLPFKAVCHPAAQAGGVYPQPAAPGSLSAFVSEPGAGSRRRQRGGVLGPKEGQKSQGRRAGQRGAPQPDPPAGGAGAARRPLHPVQPSSVAGGFLRCPAGQRGGGGPAGRRQRRAPHLCPGKHPQNLRRGAGCHADGRGGGSGTPSLAAGLPVPERHRKSGTPGGVPEGVLLHPGCRRPSGGAGRRAAAGVEGAGRLRSPWRQILCRRYRHGEPGERHLL